MTTLSAKIHQMLSEEIIDGTLKPGQKLEEAVLAERFNASRTPIREALRELNARGLVELTPRKGVVVARISVDELADMLEAMCELEALCCRLSAQRMSVVEKKQLEALQRQMNECVERGDAAGYLPLNHEFHDAITKGSQSKTLATIVDGQRQRLAAFRSAQPDGERRFAAAIDEHNQIVAAILRSDPEEAYRAMRDHTARLSIQVLARLRQQRSLEAGGKLR
ncbi:GntR family transcriptional regulator [Pandoraea terrae]|uniref:GntR family transcriptional regulator n=1 Tax=Pandoraea terrae TaxID=1537710 RepID=A0A5E4XUD9_9BURK|nr:GntR family transcriptional regulator [Pandoraea terrae]VVE39692.1 GntR family transcriptional regulator [Pandoraea terrae]